MAAPRNDNVKEKILDAATGLLDTQTFADISLAEIAAAAGVSKGNIIIEIKSADSIQALFHPLHSFHPSMQ